VGRLGIGAVRGKDSMAVVRGLDGCKLYTYIGVCISINCCIYRFQNLKSRVGMDMSLRYRIDLGTNTESHLLSTHTLLIRSSQLLTPLHDIEKKNDVGL
jgi:hypothetical protein